MGWGALLEFLEQRGSKELLETSARWEEFDESSEQAHRESCGTLRALEVFIEQLQGKIVLHLTDCLPVACSMGKGSKGSAVLHRYAVEIVAPPRATPGHLPNFLEFT
eukprot:2366723-Rhodomonas_salina.1